MRFYNKNNSVLINYKKYLFNTYNLESTNETKVSESDSEEKIVKVNSQNQNVKSEAEDWFSPKGEFEMLEKIR